MSPGLKISCLGNSVSNVFCRHYPCRPIIGKHMTRRVVGVPGWGDLLDSKAITCEKAILRF